MFEWVPLTLEWRTKTIYLTMLLGSFSLFHAVRSLLPTFWRNTFFALLQPGLWSVLGLLMLLPARLVLVLNIIPIGMMLLPCLLTPLDFRIRDEKNQ